MIRLPSMFRRLDTTSVNAALDEAEKAQRAVRVRTRAIGMDVSCGDPIGAVERILEKVRPSIFPLISAIPADMQRLLDKL